MTVTLSPAQETRLDALEPDARVIGATPTGWPIVRRPGGKVSAINHFGRLVPAAGYGRNPGGRR